MPIDLPASSQINIRGNQNPVTQGINLRQEAMQTALRALNIKVGETAMAEVKAVNTVDDSLRARLISLAYPVTNSAETGKARTANPSTPSAALNADSLMSLLKSASLKLVELEIKGRTLLTFTDRSLKTGTQVSLEFQKGGLLLLPQDPKSPSPGSHQGSWSGIDQPGQSTKNHPGIYSKGVTPGTLSNTPESTLRPTTVQSQTGNRLNSVQLATLQQELRSLLPKQDSNRAAITETLVAANLLSQIIKQPNSTLREQLPVTLQESLSIVANHLRSAEQLSQPAILKQTLSNSGMQLEQKLLSKTSLNTANPDDLNKVESAIRSNELGRILARQDLKAALLYLLSQLPVTASQPPRLQSSPSESLILLLQQFIGAPSRKQKSDSQNSRELLHNVQQLVTKALGKMAFQQLQSLQRTQISPEGVTTQHWQLEIPIRYGHEVQQFSLRIDEEWLNEQQNNNVETPSKVRQWLIKLAFDLPEAGAFHAHLIIVDDSVSASLWAENPSTLTKTQQKLGQLQQRLQKDGVNVKQIECFAGRPAEEKIQLNYSLVDIKT